MKLVDAELQDALGGVLLHNIPDAQGHKAFHKGHRLDESDLNKLRALNRTRVYVGIFEDGDVSENEAAARVAQAVAGKHLTLSAIGTGRVNFFPATRGILKVNDAALDQINVLDGITVATIPANAVVHEKKMVATVKTIGLAVPETTLRQVETIASQAGEVLGIVPLGQAQVAVILTGGAEARAGVEKTFAPAIRGRVEDLGGAIASIEYVDHAQAAIAAAIQRAQQANADCIILAGETSIMDASDVTPRGILDAGGKIELYGAPVEPGNLLLLAYWNDTPIVGAPGCVKSRDTNVVDLILPRLLAGERVRKKDLVALANGGLLI